MISVHLEVRETIIICNSCRVLGKLVNCHKMFWMQKVVNVVVVH